MTSDPAVRVSAHVVQVTGNTRWIFFQIETASGLIGTGEASLNGQEAGVLYAAEAVARHVLALPHADPAPVSPSADLAQAAAVSAMDQALWDIAARRAELPLANMLGSVRRNVIPLYANINRCTVDRSPDGFADSARAALGAGYRHLKIAPFDEATPRARQTGRLGEAIRPGLARIGAVRAAAPPDVELMVDCHWRLDVATAERVIDAAAEFGVTWLECPLPENDDTLEALRALRARANTVGARLAGCEHLIGLAGFMPFLRAGAYDVVMPDVKYAGGPGDMLKIGAAAERFGVAVSPHNPTGPICHAASLQVSAAMPALDSLEMQFGETDAFAALQSPRLPPPSAGQAALPAGPGIGTALDQEALAKLTIQRRCHEKGEET